MDAAVCPEVLIRGVSNRLRERDALSGGNGHAIGGLRDSIDGDVSLVRVVRGQE